MISSLQRISIVVPDVQPLIDFYTAVFGWKVYIDATYSGDVDFPTINGPVERSEFRVVYLGDEKEGQRIGFMSYTRPPFATELRTARTAIANGETVLVVQSEDVADLWERARAAGATIARGPSPRSYLSLDGTEEQHVMMASLFDPAGTYIEAHQWL